ncbi:3081_t:CDS:2 [Entrophospora sp. SA101]|nr:3081_t:CDS:2 [Entrophospora sp. SA101]
MARVAEDNVVVENTDPKNIGIFTQVQAKTIFGSGQKMMDLPVGSTSTGNNSLGRSTSSRIDSRAGSAMLLRKRGESTLTHLANMIQAIESFYHPSNFGRWTYSIVKFLQYLGWEFLKRWTDEQKSDCKTPVSRRLTPEIRRQFVLTLRGVTFLSMFGKDAMSVGSSQASLKYLAWLEPSLIFPGLLERVYPSLETLTEPPNNEIKCLSSPLMRDIVLWLANSA